ncbi:MAG: hypothetical protein V4579_09080 [Pseudomonadota bacterium]
MPDRTLPLEKKFAEVHFGSPKRKSPIVSLPSICVVMFDDPRTIAVFGGFEKWSLKMHMNCLPTANAGQPHLPNLACGGETRA